MRKKLLAMRNADVAQYAIEQRRYCFGDKGDDPPSPDYTPMANASAESARIGYQLGQDQLAEARRQYENNLAVAKPVVDAQLDLMKSQKEQGDDYYKYQKETFRPLEQGLVDDANAFSEEGAQEQFARQAAADLQGQQANQNAQNNRAMASMGVNPNSGKFQAIASQQGLVNAAQRAGATSNARVQADALSTAKRIEVAGLGRNLTGAAQGSYGMALNAGNSAVSNNAQAGNSLVNSTSAGNSTIMQGQGMQLSGLGSVLNGQTSIYQSNTQRSAADSQGTGQMIGAGLGVATALMCDARLKENLRRIGTTLDGFALYLFNYIGDPSLHIGVIAQEVLPVKPEAVIQREDGFYAVDYSQIGMTEFGG